jgi:hypothetical protein
MAFLTAVVLIVLPQIARSIDFNNCGSVAPADAVKEVQDLIANNKVVVFGFGPCPCTDFARERLDTASICYAEMVQPMLYTSNEPHLKYLQCQYGAVHSFTFIGGELVGDDRGMIDSDTLPDEEFYTYLTKAGADYTCTKNADEIHHPSYLDPFAEQLSQIDSEMTQSSPGVGVVLEKTLERYFETSPPKNNNHRHIVHHTTESEYSLGVATLLSVGVLVLASLGVAGRVIVPRIAASVQRQTGGGEMFLGQTPAVAFPATDDHNQLASESVGDLLAADCVHTGVTSI